MRNRCVFALLVLLLLFTAGCSDFASSNGNKTTPLDTSTYIGTSTSTTRTSIVTTIKTTSEPTSTFSSTGNQPNITNTTPTSTHRTGYNSTTATPENAQLTEKIGSLAVEKSEISIFCLDEGSFDKLVRDANATSFLYTKKMTYPQDGDLFYRGLMSPFRVNQELIKFAGSPSKVEKYLQENNVHAQVKYATLIYTQFVPVTLYLQTNDGIYFIAVKSKHIPDAGQDASAYTYHYALYDPTSFTAFVEQCRKEQKSY